jgi:hypothetical protein
VLDPKPYRSTMGLCLGMRGGLASAIVVVSVKRTDPARTLFVTHEWEDPHLNLDVIAAALLHARTTFHTVLTIGYYGGRDDEKIFSTLSVRLGQHIEPAPHDNTAPTQILIDDFRVGRLKARPDSLVVRDAKAAIWRDGVPDQTGIIAALRCAHWAAQQYRVVGGKTQITGEEKTAALAKERKRRMENPF